VHRWHFSKWYKLTRGTNRAVFLSEIAVTPQTNAAELKILVAQKMEAALTGLRENK
jgi:hypothetical protein